MATLLLKLTLAPMLVVGASMAGRFWGPRAAGLFASLPIVAGPVLLTLALEQGESFAADAATGTLLAMVAIAAYLVSLASVSARAGTGTTLAVGWAVFLVIAVAIAGTDVRTVVAALAGGVALGLAALALPRSPDVSATASRTVWDLPLRAGAAAALVVAVTGAADAAGPRLSGALALSPIALTVLCGFTLATEGRPAMLALLRGIVVGLPAVICFFTVVAVTIEAWSVAAAFGAATGLALCLQATVARASASRAATAPG